MDAAKSKTRVWCIAAVAWAAALPGCRAGINQELLERELRWQEDRIYELQQSLEECSRRLDSSRRENESLLSDDPRASGGRPGTGAPRRTFDDPQPSDPDELQAPRVELPGDSTAEPYDGPPEIQPPGSAPEGIRRDAPEAPDDDASLPGPSDGSDAPAASDGAGALDASALSGASEAVAAITLNRRLTGGHNADNQPGDEGVMVVVEPRDAQGHLVHAAGALSVVLLDPAQSGKAARVARWDFSADEAAAHMRSTPMGDGLHFELRWPHSPPVNPRLAMYVRLTTADGRKLVVEKQIDVDPPSRPLDRWTDEQPQSPTRGAAGNRQRPTRRATAGGQAPPYR